jgi:hypothetical protein
MKITTIAAIAPVDISSFSAPETEVVLPVPLPVYVAVELELLVLDPPEY